MGRVLKYLFYLMVLAALALAVYAAFADLRPPVRDMVIEAPASVGD